MSRFFWICLGGAVGTGARYLVSGWALALLGPAFPFGTLAVNMTGSFLLGGIMHLALTTGLLAPTLRLALTSGVLGGFTTYSTFNYETLEYLRGGAWAIGIANILLTVVACLAAGVGGLAVAQWWTGA
jgi:fluoride exporter